MTLNQHTILMYQTAIPTGVGPIFESESGERVTITDTIHEDMGRPGTIVVDVRPGLIEDYGTAPEPEAPSSSSDDETFFPLEFLRKHLGDEVVDGYLAAFRIPNPDRADRADAVLRAVETIKKTGGAVEIAGVRIEPCDTYGQTDTTRELELLRRQVRRMVEVRELGPVVISRDEMPVMDVREHDSVHIDTTNTSFVFFLETDKLRIDDELTVAGVNNDLVAKARPEPHGDFERTTAIAIRNLRAIVEDENADPEIRIRAAKLILDQFQ